MLITEQLSLIVSILTALLTGGFIILFIESQQFANSQVDRFHFIMNPFFHSFSNYVKFISSFKACFTFKGSNDSDYIKRLEKNVETIARLAGQTIISGQDYPSDYFTAKELDSICNKINDIWYCFDRRHEYIYNHLDFDSQNAELFDVYINDYLKAISQKYDGIRLTKELLAKVSSEFYLEKYLPIKYILHEYELWKRKEKDFKILALTTVVFTLLTMILILLLSFYFPIWVIKLLCVVSCLLLIIELFKLIKLVNLSNTIMR